MHCIHEYHVYHLLYHVHVYHVFLPSPALQKTTYDDDDLYASASSSTKKSVCNYCRQPGHFKDACKKLLDKIARNGGGWVT